MIKTIWMNSPLFVQVLRDVQDELRIQCVELAQDVDIPVSHCKPFNHIIELLKLFNFLQTVIDLDFAKPSPTASLTE